MINHHEWIFIDYVWMIDLMGWIRWFVDFDVIDFNIFDWFNFDMIDWWDIDFLMINNEYIVY